MARNKASQSNINNSQPLVYLNGRIQDDDGSGNGTPVNESVYGDIHQFFAKAMSLYGIIYSNFPDNEINGYQLIDAVRALAGKNDYILDLVDTSPADTDKIQINLKLGKLTAGEFFICKATVEKLAQTKLVGSDNVIRTLSFQGDFKIGEYVRATNTNTTILIERLVDSQNLQNIALELAFLQAATPAESLLGLIDTKAETPLTSALTFVERVVGSLSDQSLASLIRNGLYPKEHFEIVANLGDPAVKNIGTFTGFDIGGGSIGQTYTVSGDITQVTTLGVGSGQHRVQVDFANQMADANYFVRIHFQTLSAGAGSDAERRSLFPVSKNHSINNFVISVAEVSGGDQNYKVALEVVKL